MSAWAPAGDLPSIARRRAWRERLALSRPAAASVALLAAGVALWSLSLSHIRLDRMTDIGLPSVLPVGTWVSLALVTAGCAVAWRLAEPALMALGVATTILVLHGLGVLGEPTMRFATAWQHVGIADYIATHGSVDPSIDAYFNWPGFFILGAFVSKVAGLHDIEPVARAAPLFLNALYVPPLVSIGQSLFADRRVVWLGAWIFVVANWIGQDYFSPQGLNFFMYLVVLAIVLRWFRGGPGRERGGWPWRAARALAGRARAVPETTSTWPQRATLIVVVALIVLGIAASHQLTPFALITGTATLTLVGWCRIRTLPVIVALIVGGWLAYMAVTYLVGHVHLVTGDVGAVDVTVGSNVGRRLHGSPGHQAIVELRVVSTLVLWAVAGLGFLRLARGGRLIPALAVLALSPFPLLGLQSYGGEVLLRIALLSLPFMALAAASLFVPAEAGASVSRVAWTALACLGVALVASFPFNRYGNERMDYFSPDEIAGVRALYRIAPQGATLFAGSAALPWRYTKYADYYYYDSLTGGDADVNLDDPDQRRLARDVALRMATPDRSPSLLIITRSTAAQTDLFGPWREGAQLRLRRVLSRSPYFRVAYRNPDAVVFVLRRVPRERR
ncbi:MAG TPA: hypothetical protein VHB30_10225 [Solirubrobacteraceae bacterium]|nr:hypothetical protein [Solirubrobacteraceae bacterium]